MSSLFRWEEPRKWLFCFTHPDDELAIAASVRRLVRRGHEVHCSWTHTTKIRSKEARDAMELVGVSDPYLHFFDGSDGSVCDEIVQLLPQFKEMINSIRPDVVVTGAFEQGHLDHDSTSYMIHRSFTGEILEFPLYHWYRWRSIQIVNKFSNPDSQEMIQLDREEIEFKIKMARRYPSQTIYNSLKLNHFKDVLTLARPRTIERELIRVSQRPDFLRPNHPERLSKKIERHPRWKRWDAAIRRIEGIEREG